MTALSVRPDQLAYRELGHHLLLDHHSDEGPLTGVLSAMEWAMEIGASQVLTVPGDTPFIPLDLVERLLPGPSCAVSVQHVHPLIALWPVSSAQALSRYLSEARLSGDRRRFAVRPFADQITTQHVVFPVAGEDPFFNINRPEDVQHFEDCVATDFPLT